MSLENGRFSAGTLPVFGVPLVASYEGGTIKARVAGFAPVSVATVTDEPSVGIVAAESLNGGLLVEWWETAATVTTRHVARSRDGGATWVELDLAAEPIPY
jgi:hypothetical protein